MSLSNLFSFLKSHVGARSAFKKTRIQIEQAQQRQFKRLMTETLSKSDFYQKYQNRPLEEYPILDKRQHLAAFNDINTVGLDRDQAFSAALRDETSREFTEAKSEYAIGLSSGTSGKRGLFVTSTKERAEWAGYITAKMIRSIRHTRRIAFFLRANNALYESVNNLWVDFRFYDLQIPLDRHLKALSEFSPLILIAPAQTLQLIAKAQRELDRFSISPKQIVSVAEVLDPQDKAFIEETFGIAVDQIYQCTEGLLACTCPHGSLHLNEDAIIIEKEWIDKDSGRFVPVITDLRRQSQPIVRYRLDDVLVVDEEPCSCGSSLTRLKFIEGRCDDMLVFNSARKTEKDNNHRFVFADIMRRTLLKVDGLADYRVVQDAPEALSLFLSPFNEDTQASTQSHIHALCEAQEVKVPDCAFFPLDNESQQLKDKDLMTKRRRIVKNFAHGE